MIKHKIKQFEKKRCVVIKYLSINIGNLKIGIKILNIKIFDSVDSLNDDKENILARNKYKL